MLSEDDLRTRLAVSVGHLDADVEAELDQLLRRAHRRTWVRRTSYAVGLVAAVAVVALLVGRSWSPADSEPEPIDQVPVQPLFPKRGEFMDPAGLEPGRYRVELLGVDMSGVDISRTATSATPDVEINVPTGWGQDDKYALATGAPDRATTRRIDLYAHVTRVHVDVCTPQLVKPGPGTLDFARALASVDGVRAAPPEPVTLDGHAGYFLRVQVPTSPAAEGACPGQDFRLYPVLDHIKSHVRAGWTDLIWVVDHDGQRLVIDASHGPDATPAQVDELVRMVQSIAFVDPDRDSQTPTVTPNPPLGPAARVQERSAP